jgi:hypothetical protein
MAISSLSPLGEETSTQPQCSQAGRTIAAASDRRLKPQKRHSWTKGMPEILDPRTPELEQQAFKPHPESADPPRTE